MTGMWCVAGTSATGVTAPGKGAVGPPEAAPLAAEVVVAQMAPGMSSRHCRPCDRKMTQAVIV